MPDFSPAFCAALSALSPQMHRLPATHLDPPPQLAHRIHKIVLLNFRPVHYLHALVWIQDRCAVLSLASSES